MIADCQPGSEVVLTKVKPHWQIEEAFAAAGKKLTPMTVGGVLSAIHCCRQSSRLDTP